MSILCACMQFTIADIHRKQSTCGASPCSQLLQAFGKNMKVLTPKIADRQVLGQLANTLMTSANDPEVTTSQPRKELQNTEHAFMRPLPWCSTRYTNQPSAPVRQHHCRKQYCWSWGSRGHTYQKNCATVPMPGQQVVSALHVLPRQKHVMRQPEPVLPPPPPTRSQTARP